MRTKATQPVGELHPCNEQGASKGNRVGEQVRLDFSTKVADQIVILYRALQGGVEVFGGIDALASETKKSAALTRLKVFRREDTKGDTQRAHIDLLAHVVADPHARSVIVGSLLDDWGYKPAELKREPTAEEKLKALQIALDAAGDLGNDVRARAARAGGFDPSVLKR